MISSNEEFHRFSISYHDLEKALEFAQAAQNHVANTIEFEALLFAAIVTYYRPFSPNEKKPLTATSSLDIAKLVQLTPAEQALHDECKRLRNKALAHSEHALNPTSINPERSVVMSKPFSLFINPPKLPELISLIDKVRQACLIARGRYMSNHP